LIAKSAQKPSTPPAPVLDTVTGTSITVKLFESEDNGGDSTPIVYELFVNDESLGAPVNASTYVTPLMTFT